MWVIWMGAHRSLFFGLISLVIWVGAAMWYLRVDIDKYFKRRRAHNWSVDMATRTGMGSTEKAKH